MSSVRIAHDPQRTQGATPESPRRLEALAVPALLCATFVYLLARCVADPDLWGHVRFGLDLLGTGRLVRPDPYSYMAGGQPWINHEWVAEALFALVYRAAGGTGLVVGKVALGLTIFGLLYAHLVRRGLPSIRAGMLVLAGYIPVSIGTLTIRPHIFTYLCFVLVVLAMEAADRGRTKWLWALPVVFAFWANAHGGFLAGAAVLVTWGAAHLVVERLGRGAGPRVSTAFILVILGLSFLATLANPHGLDLWGFLLRTATIPRPEITEWSSLSPLTADGKMYLVILALTGVVLARKAPPPHAPLIAVYAVVAPMPILALRHLPLFVLAALVIAAEPLAAVSRRVGKAGPRQPAPRWFPAALLLGAALMIGLSVSRFRGAVIDGAQQPVPARAIALLDASDATGNMAVHFDWGEYAIWHLAPDVKVSWDGRRETIYGPEAYAANLWFFFGVREWDRLLREYDTELALVSPQMPVYNLLKATEAWSIVYEDSLAAIFAPDGSPQARRIRATRPPEVPITGDGLLFP